MTLFRFHRGGLEASMATVSEFSSKSELCSLLRGSGSGSMGFWCVDDGEVDVKYYCYDQRTGWDTHIVTLSGACVGFTNGPLPSE